MITLAPCDRSFTAQALAIAGLLPCVLHVRSFTFVAPVLLIVAMCDFAVASAGPSNGAMFPMPSYAQPIVSVFCGAAAPPVATATATAAAAATASAALHTFLISLLLSLRSLPRCFLSSDECVQQGVERHRHVVPRRLPDDRAGDQLDLRRTMRRDVLEHRRVVRGSALRREDVHLPGVVMELDPG